MRPFAIRFCRNHWWVVALVIGVLRGAFPGGAWAGAEGEPQSVSGGASPTFRARMPANGSPAKNAPTGSAARLRGALPNDQGQIWREYDLSSYTSQITGTAKPEQAVIDWILRETGTEIWFSEPLGVLSASKSTLRVYHTPEVHQVISDLVDRFLANGGESYTLGLQLCSVGSPNWRAKLLPLMRPVSVQSPGIEAWLVSRENAALLVAELRKRVDYREHHAQQIAVQNGQSATLSRLRPRTYSRTVRALDSGAGFDLETGQIEEGYSLQISPLYSLDNRTIDTVIHCRVDQVEKLIPVTLDLTTIQGLRQSMQIQVPQLVSWRLHERFRWPADQVLVLSCGVVAAPAEDRTAPIPLPFLASATRADAMLFIESQGRLEQQAGAAPSQASSPNTRGRY